VGAPARLTIPGAQGARQAAARGAHRPCSQAALARLAGFVLAAAMTIASAGAADPAPAPVAPGVAPPRIVGPSAGEAGWTITGHCRHGRPQGVYAVRAADGRLRVQGAYNQGERTGSFFFWSSDGARIAQLPFDANLISGTLSLWYDGRGGEPLRKLEAAYRSGERDGATRLWSVDGRLIGEFEYAAGALRAAQAWSDDGAVLGEADARGLAERERAETATFLATLLATLSRHPPDCHPPPARLRAAAGVVSST
jgi:hypothetical protein